MAHFYRHPSGERISTQTVSIPGNSFTFGLYGPKDFDGNNLIVGADSEDVTVTSTSNSGITATYTIAVNPNRRVSSAPLNLRIFCMTSQGAEWDWFSLIFTPRSASLGKYTVTPFSPPGQTPSINNLTTMVDEYSLLNQVEMKFTLVSAQGSVLYFQLDQDVVPKYFAVTVPDGLFSPEHVHLFFHPIPGQADYKDSTYFSGGLFPIFRYAQMEMATLFCAAQTNQVLIVPLMTTASAGNCGILPQNWESIFSQILGYLNAGVDVEFPDPVPVKSLVVSSFSAGIAYSHAFRRAGNVGSRLRGIIDFDGMMAEDNSGSKALHVTGAMPIMRFWQYPPDPRLIPVHAAQNLFSMDISRWGEPYRSLISVIKDPVEKRKAVHRNVARNMMYIAAKRTAANT